MTLREGFTSECLPHQLRLHGGNVLVIVPGRAPLCLRCQKTGHIRKECKVPRCDQCNRYGHSSQDCAVTYAIVTSNATANDTADLVMDAEEAESAADNTAPVQEEAPVEKTAASATERVSSAGNGHPAQASASAEPAGVTVPDAEMETVGESVQKKRPAPTDDAASGDDPTEDELESMTEQDGEDIEESARASRLQQRWSTVTSRRKRYNPKPRPTAEDRRRESMKQVELPLPGKGNGTT